MTERGTGDDAVDSLEGFVQQLIEAQSRLRAFIVAAIGNHANAADVLQKTNMVLWKKAKEFRQGADFLPWAVAIARYEVLGFLRDYRRDRHVFSDDVTTMILDAAANEVADPNDRQAALQRCVEKLPGHSRTLLWQRYKEGMSIKQISSKVGRSEDSIKSRLLRLRKKLETCIEAFLRTSSA